MPTPNLRCPVPHTGQPSWPAELEVSRNPPSSGNYLFQPELHMDFALPGKGSDGDPEWEEPLSGDWSLSEGTGAVSEWEEQGGALGFDPASISVSGLTHFKPNDNRPFDETFPSSGYVTLQRIFFFSFTSRGFSRASPTRLQQNSQFQL